MYGLNAHVWSRRGGGVTPCSECIVGDELPFIFEGGGSHPIPKLWCEIKTTVHIIWFRHPILLWGVTPPPFIKREGGVTSRSHIICLVSVCLEMYHTSKIRV